MVRSEKNSSSAIFVFTQNVRIEKLIVNINEGQENIHFGLSVNDF